jgi:hypothetical protein
LLAVVVDRKAWPAVSAAWAAVAVDVDGLPVVLVNNWLWQDPPTFDLLVQSAAA